MSATKKEEIINMCSLKMLGPNFNDMLVSIIKISKVIMETEIREIVLTLDITAESATINKINKQNCFYIFVMKSPT